MPSETARVFLLSDSPDLDLLIRDFAEFLKSQQPPTIEPILLADSEEPMDVANSRERREGDYLFTLFGETEADATAAAVECCQQGATQQMLIVPVFTRSGRPTASSLRALDDAYPLHRINLEVAYETLLPNLYGILRGQCALGSTQSDLFLNWPREGLHTPAAISFLQNDEAAKKTAGKLATSADESRQQAARAIEARLFEAARHTLKQAATFDATSAVTCHWRARLFAASNRREDLSNALREATRSARLANMNEPGSLFETSGWHLAAYIAARLGDHGAVREYLEEMLRHDHGDIPLALNTAALLLRINENAAALQHLEGAYTRDPEALEHALAMPALAPLRPQLDQLHAKRKTAIREALGRLFQSEDYLITHSPLEDLEARRNQQVEAGQRCRDLASLHILEDELRTTAVRQIEHLGIWAEHLCARHIELSTLRRQHTALSDTLEVPPRSPWDGPLEFFWPTARHLRRALDTAREETRALRLAAGEKLTAETDAFLASLNAFLRAVEHCEAAIAEAPMLYSRRADAEEPKAGELAFLTASDFARLGLKQDPVPPPRRPRRIHRRDPRSAERADSRRLSHGGHRVDRARRQPLRRLLSRYARRRRIRLKTGAPYSCGLRNDF